MPEEEGRDYIKRLNYIPEHHFAIINEKYLLWGHYDLPAHDPLSIKNIGSVSITSDKKVVKEYKAIFDTK